MPFEMRLVSPWTKSSRGRRDNPELFKLDTPEDVRRAHLTAALDATHADGRPDHGVRLKAAEQLAGLDATKGRGAGSGRVTVVLAAPEHEWQANRCPNCDAILGNRVSGGA